MLNGFTISNTADRFSGTTTVVLKGGTFSGNGVLEVPLSFDGNIAIAGASLDFGPNAVLTYVSGTVTHGGTVNVNTGVTFNTGNNIQWNNMIFTAATTIVTLNSVLLVTNMTANAGVGVNFQGTAAFIADNFTSLAVDLRIFTMTAGLNYRVKYSFDVSLGRRVQSPTFTSSHATNKVVFTIDMGATVNTNANFTRIDFSNGRPVNTWNGVVTDSINVNSYSDLQTVAKAFI